MQLNWIPNVSLALLLCITATVTRGSETVRHCALQPSAHSVHSMCSELWHTLHNIDVTQTQCSDKNEAHLKRSILGPFYFRVPKHSLHFMEFLSSVLQERNAIIFKPHWSTCKPLSQWILFGIYSHNKPNWSSLWTSEMFCEQELGVYVRGLEL